MRAAHLDMKHEVLAENEQPKPEDDVRYLWPHIIAVTQEIYEKEKYDTMEPQNSNQK